MTAPLDPLDRLDEVAARLAHWPIHQQSMVGDIADSDAEDDAGPRLWRFARAVITVVPMGLRAIKAMKSMPDAAETLHLYRDATGKSHDDAAADIAVIEQRLGMLVSVFDDKLQPEEIERITRFLTQWAAGGRPKDPRMADVDSTFTLVAREGDRGGEAWRSGAYEARFRRHIAAWRALLASL